MGRTVKKDQLAPHFKAPKADMETGVGVAVEVDPGVQAGHDWSDVKNWPSRVETFEEAMGLLTYLWGKPRAYSVQDLTLLSQVRFEASRKKKIPAQYLIFLRQLARRWESRDFKPMTSIGALHGVFPEQAHLTHKPAPEGAKAEEPAAIEFDWRVGLPT